MVFFLLFLLFFCLPGFKGNLLLLDVLNKKNRGLKQMEENKTPLQRFADSASSTIQGADPDVVSEDAGNRAALHFAAYEGHVEAAR